MQQVRIVKKYLGLLLAGLLAVAWMAIHSGAWIPGEYTSWASHLEGWLESPLSEMKLWQLVALVLSLALASARVPPYITIVTLVVSLPFILEILGGPSFGMVPGKLLFETTVGEMNRGVIVMLVTFVALTNFVILRKRG